MAPHIMRAQGAYKADKHARPTHAHSSKNAEHKIQRVYKISTNEIIKQGRKWNLTTCEKCTKQANCLQAYNHY